MMFVKNTIKKNNITGFDTHGQMSRVRNTFLIGSQNQSSIHFNQTRPVRLGRCERAIEPDADQNSKLWSA